MSDFHIYTKLGKTPILIRPLIPEDKDLILEGFRRLSSRSKYLRFFSASYNLSDKELDALVKMQNKDHLAIGALDLTQDPAKGMGLARYIQSEDDPNSAEIALVVLDDYQKQGLGILFMEVLFIIAQKNGYKSLCAYVMSENNAMIKILKPYAPSVKYIENGIVRFNVSLSKQNANRNVSNLF